MGSSTSQSTNQSTSASSSFVPSYSEEPILEALSKYVGGLGTQVSNWAQGVWNGVQGTSQDAIKSYDALANTAANNGATYNAASKQGVDQFGNLIHDANTYNSVDRQKYEMGRAEAGVEQSGQAAMDAHKRDLASFGINPSDGQYAELDEANRLSTGAAAAAAGQNAYDATAATGRQLRADAIQAGDQYGNLASNSYNTALQGVAGASNTNLATANTGVNLQQAADPLFNTAMSLKYPPLGNTSASQSTGQSTSNSITDPASGGGSKSPSQQQQQPQQQGGGGGGSPFGGGGGGGGTSGGGASPSEWSPVPPEMQDPGSTDLSGNTGWSDPNNLDPYGSYGLNNNDPMAGETGGIGGGWSDPGNLDPYGSYGFGSGGASSDPYSFDSSQYTSVDPSSFDGSGGGGGDYARGGMVGQQQVPKQQRPMSSPFNFQGGGQVQPGMSPSHGGTTDDVRANLNSGEFVVPRDVVQHKGHEFFQKLIAQSRQANMKHQAMMQQSRGPFNGRR